MQGQKLCRGSRDRATRKSLLPFLVREDNTSKQEREQREEEEEEMCRGEEL